MWVAPLITQESNFCFTKDKTKRLRRSFVEIRRASEANDANMIIIVLQN